MDKGGKSRPERVWPEVLQNKVMTFVNQIAEIVHGVVDEFHGAANKNNGDTFLMIWTVRGDSQKASQGAGTYHAYPCSDRQIDCN